MWVYVRLNERGVLWRRVVRLLCVLWEELLWVVRFEVI